VKHQVGTPRRRRLPFDTLPQHNTSQKTKGESRQYKLQLGLHPCLHTDVFREPFPPFLVSMFLCHTLLSPSNDALGEESDVFSRMGGVKADSDAGGAFWNGGWVDGLGVKHHRPNGQ